MTIALNKVPYTTAATAHGGRAGHVKSADGVIDFDLAQPGTTAEPAVNPETLFAAGYAACFQGALANRAKTKGVDTSDSTVTAEVSFGPSEDGGFGLAVELEVQIPGVDADAGAAAGRAGAPVLPVLQGHPGQHRGDPHGRLNRRLRLRPDQASGPPPSPLSALLAGCQDGGSVAISVVRPVLDRHRAVVLAHRRADAGGADVRAGLADDGLLAQVERVRAELFGSLARPAAATDGQGGGARPGGRDARRTSTPPPSGRARGGPQGRAGAAARQAPGHHDRRGPGAAPPVDAAVPPQRHALHRVLDAADGSDRRSASDLLLGRRRLRGGRARRPAPTGSRRTTRCCRIRSPPARNCCAHARARPG